MAVTSKRPFWMHQLVEYILGGSMIAAGLHSPTPRYPPSIGVIVMLHAAITVAPLGAFRVISRKVHRFVDIAVIGFEVVAGVQPWIDLDSGTPVPRCCHCRGASVRVVEHQLRDARQGTADLGRGRTQH